MFLMRILYRWIDPDRLIQVKSWWIIGALASLTGLLFLATLLLMSLGEHSIKETFAMRDNFTDTNVLGRELDNLENQIRQYDQDLRIYINRDEPASLQHIQKDRAAILESASSLYRLVTQGDWSDLGELKAMINGIFNNGETALALNQRKRKTEALATLNKTSIMRLHNDILHLSNGLFHRQLDSLNLSSEADTDIARGGFQNMLILLASLAGIVFILLLCSMARTTRRVMADRRAFRQLYEEKQQGAAFTQNLINVLPIGYHSVDSSGVIVEMNQTQLDWLGYTRAEIVGKKHLFDLICGLERVRYNEVFNTLKQEGYIRNLELTIYAKNGDLIPVLFNSRAIYDDKDRFSHSITTVYNFTERKKLEDALVLARQEAENAQQLKQLFMANMSHEIRTPLNAILGFANLLGRTRLPQDQKEYVHCIQVSGANLLTIVNDILDFEKIQSGMLRIEQVEFDLPGLLHSVVTMVRPSARDKGLTLHLEADPELPTLLIGDPMRLTQILINLLGNAIKFTDSGSVTLHVKALNDTAAGSPTRIRFDVEDTGIGISKPDQERIFERFVQASSDAMRRFSGTGLGLALVKMLVELQQGAIRLMSAEGCGSIFSVEIPYRAAVVQGPKILGIYAEPETGHDFSGHRILLVEDNVMNRRIAELQLLEFGLSVTMAANGFEAIEYLRSDPAAFSVVFMDIQMPDMDGYTTTHHIRYELDLHAIPIIAITAHVLTGEREKVLASGMNDYLTKPVRPNDLASILTKYLPSQPIPNEGALLLSPLI